MSEQRSTGRRVAERPARRGLFSPVIVAAVVAVLVTAGALALQKPADRPETVPDQEPATKPLTSLSLLCPSGVAASPDLVIGTGRTEMSSESGGGLVSRPASGEKSTELEVGDGGIATGTNPKAVVVTGTGDYAPGLFGARFGGPGRPAAGECAQPTGERWFIGAGAGGLHESRLLLANPDIGPAVADVSLWTTTGELIDADSRGVTIPGRSSTVLDLAKVAPSREEVAALVTVSRGRVAASMSDTYTARTGAASDDWLPSSATPAESQIIPGLPRRMAEPTLTLLNPGTDVGRVSLEVVGERSSFSPKGVDEIKVAAGEVAVTELPESLVKLLAEENASLRLTSTVPVTGSVRAVVAGDLVHLPSAEETDRDGATALPGVEGSVLTLTPTAVAGRVQVEFPGQDLEPVTVRLKPGLTTSVPVPARARSLVVRGKAGYVGAVRTVTRDGASLLGLQPLTYDQLIPSVRPEWP